ncbi:hypothetical protein AYK20_02650 [Thermoplasmatales archaeon SG8-52-1]|nr:MAG: hypothetical protein AYK20_02650 [Thermoplasmatales archaeon SG8-52-1]
MRKKLVSILVITLLITIVILPIVNSLNVNEKSISVDDEIKITVKLSDKGPYKICFPSSKLDLSPNKIDILPNMAHPAIAFAGDQIHPAFGRTPDGIHMVAYKDVDYGEIIWGFSEDDGYSYDGWLYWSVGGDYPSIKHWDDKTFYGAFVADPMDNNGGVIYLFKTDNPTDTYDYEIDYWDVSGYGFYNMIDAEIACDSSQNEYEWGVSSFIISRYGYYTDGPTIVYSDEDTEGDWWISWYYYDGCNHTDVDIDHDDKVSYAIYDWEDTVSGENKLLCRVKDFTDPVNGSDNMYEIGISGNKTYTFSTLRNQSIAVANGRYVICAEIDGVENDVDIICIYGTSMGTPSYSFVAKNPEVNETNPVVGHIVGNAFVVTYNTHDTCSMPRAIKASVTYDGGISWSNKRWQLNDNYDCVVEGYKTHDLCENGELAMWTEDCGSDIDIYIASVFGNQPPDSPTISGPNTGKPNTDYDFTFNSLDPDGDDVRYHIEWGDGDIEITALAPQGTDVSVSHKWTEEGTYTITAYAEDELGLTSVPSTKTFKCPRSKALYNPLINWLQYYPNLFPILKQLLGF